MINTGISGRGMQENWSESKQKSRTESRRRKSPRNNRRKKMSHKFEFLPRPVEKVKKKNPHSFGLERLNFFFFHLEKMSKTAPLEGIRYASRRGKSFHGTRQRTPRKFKTWRRPIDSSGIWRTQRIGQLGKANEFFQ